jgi:very-short-patch-repair endonuclease
MACARTLIDISHSATEAQLELALEDARRRNLVTPKRLEERLAAMPANQAGRRNLLKVLGHLTGTRPTESTLEVKVLQMLRREGYPKPIRQEVLNDDGEFAGRVDLIYPERRLIIEVQSHRWHSDRSTGDADSERANRHQAMGWTVMEARHNMLRGEGRAKFLGDLARTYNRRLA